jgi:DNA-binding NarL/FixJ family response regulator
LVITEGTVKNHVTAILGKLEVEDRIQVSLRGKTLGLL